MGARRLLRPPAEVVTREQAQLVRLFLMCAAWALGRVLVHGALTQFDPVPFVPIVPVALAIGAYVVTEDLGRPRVDRGNVRYWRGRRIDEDPPKRDRLN